MELTLRNRSLAIGGDTYPLQSIARVGVRHYTIPKTTYYKPAGILVAFGLLLCASGEAGAVIFGLVALLAGGALGYVSFNAQDKDWYSLHLETAGSPKDAIFSRDRSAVVRLRDQIVDHLERPQEQSVTFNLGDTFVTGDQINVDGLHNTGKAVS